MTAYTGSGETELRLFTKILTTAPIALNVETKAICFELKCRNSNTNGALAG